MADGIESVARVGLAGWVGEREYGLDAPPVLGVMGGELQLVEIAGGNRELILRDLVEQYQVDDRSLGIEIAFFGDAGGFFASSMNFFERWPECPADMPAEVLVDDHHKAAFTKSGDEVVMTVRHARRPSDGPPRRRLRFRPNEYEQAMIDVARDSRRLRDDLIAVAKERAPQKLESLRAAMELWPGCP
jgi:hypothetical protein